MAWIVGALGFVVLVAVGAILVTFLLSARFGFRAAAYQLGIPRSTLQAELEAGTSWEELAEKYDCPMEEIDAALVSARGVQRAMRLTGASKGREGSGDDDGR